MARAAHLTNGYTYTNSAPTVSAIAPSSGSISGGTSVTIAGSGFLTGATVKLGGTAATNVTVVNSASITATTAAHAAGAVNVLVTNTDGQNGTLTSGYTYTNPAPTVSSITPNSGTSNGGDGVTIAGTGFLSGATVKLGGTAATNVTVVNGTSITATTSAHAAGAVNVVVTNTDGQSGSVANGYTYTSSLGLTIPPDDPSSVTVTAGQAASYILSLGGNGASGTASLSCSMSPTPKGANCSVPASVTFSSTAATTFNVSVTTTSSAVAALRPSVSPRAPWSWTLAMAMLGIVILPGVRVLQAITATISISLAHTLNALLAPDVLWRRQRGRGQQRRSAHQPQRDRARNLHPDRACDFRFHYGDNPAYLDCALEVDSMLPWFDSTLKSGQDPHAKSKRGPVSGPSQAEIQPVC